MPSPSKRKEKLGAIFGLSLLAFAMAWRWLFPLLGQMHWPTWGSDHDIAVAPPAPMPKPIESATAQVASPSEEAALADIESTVPSRLDKEQTKALAEALKQADAAVRERHWLSPPDDNAMDWYGKALAIDPRSPDARIGRAALLESLFKQAEAGLDDSDAEPANELIEALNARDLADSRAHALAARRAIMEQVQPLLQEAAERMANGAYIEPENANARSSYRAALALDARNRNALKGMLAIESHVLDAALTAASGEDFDAAERLWTEASQLQTGSEALLGAKERIDDLKRRHAAGLMARAETALAARDIAGARALLQRAAQLGAEAGYVSTLSKLLDNANLYGRYQPGERFRDAYTDRSGEGPNLVVIPIGRLRMGAAESEPMRKANESPQHEVEIARPFAMATTEITVAEFRRFVRDSGYVTLAQQQGSSRYYEEQSGRIIVRKGIDWQKDYSGGKAKANDPVVHVAWRDAEAYVTWLSAKTGLRYRLPSEAEFEYALRAGSESEYPWGAAAPPQGVGNVTGDGDRSRSKRQWDNAFTHYRDGFWGPAPVAQFAANPFGLMDMVGNVSEWVEDCWHENYQRAPADGAAWVNRGCAKRVVRGSSWGSAPEQSRSAFRANSNEDTRSARIGFRVVREL
jgi:formylglycine-generating enzyme required for sulfatase activity